MPSQETEIAVLKDQLSRVSSRLSLLEQKNEATTAILNKWGGGIAVAIILSGALWALISTNIKTLLGH